MKWFQHSTDSHDDPDISDAEDKFGDAGYNVFFKTLELYGREFDNLKGKKLTLSKVFFRRKLRKSWTKLQQILSFYQERGRIFSTFDDEYITIEIPKFIEKAGNWTKRKHRVGR